MEEPGGPPYHEIPTPSEASWWSFKVLGIPRGRGETGKHFRRGLGKPKRGGESERVSEHTEGSRAPAEGTGDGRDEK